jgi:hypothetical protein
MTELVEGRSRTIAIFAGIGISFAGFIAIALLSTLKPAQWIVPLSLLGGAYYYRQKATDGIWGFSTRRTSNIGWWTGGFAAFFALAGGATPSTSEKQAIPARTSAQAIAAKVTEDAEAKRAEMRDEPEKFVDLENMKWSKDFSMMELSVTIKNNSEFALKDFAIDCEHSGPSGTVMDSNRREIFEIVEAGKSKRIKNFNMGFINSQAVSTACVITRAKIIEG